MISICYKRGDLCVRSSAETPVHSVNSAPSIGEHLFRCQAFFFPHLLQDRRQFIVDRNLPPDLPMIPLIKSTIDQGSLYSSLHGFVKGTIRNPLVVIRPYPLPPPQLTSPHTPPSSTWHFSHPTTSGERSVSVFLHPSPFQRRCTAPLHRTMHRNSHRSFFP